MAIEHACVRVVRKPWGSTDLQPWSNIHHDDDAIGELWFQRANMNAPDPALLLKLLFTKEPLSIQVHPDDDFAQSIGLARGKTEAWYILAATHDAKVAVGLKRPLEAPQLRAAIEDGSISDIVQWHRVLKNDVIFVPAGTIHAIGAGLVIAEIQQRSDATFRLFDHGRQRELHVDKAVAAARTGFSEFIAVPKRLSEGRTLLVASQHFVVERIDLRPNSSWELNAKRETWILILEGHARVGLINAFVGEAIFMEVDRAEIEVGPDGLQGLVAYLAAEPNPDFLSHNLDERAVDSPSHGFARPTHHHRGPAEARL